MKKTFFKVAALCTLLMATAASTFAQGSFAYQAVIRTSDGKIVSDQSVGMKFTLLSDGTAYYSEEHTPKTNAYGNVSVMVGAGNKLSGDFMKVPWNSMKVMLKIEVDAKGGKNYIELGTIQLQPVPYAFYAKQAGGAQQAMTASPDDAIFEVKDKDGQVVFAVYPDGVKVYVDDSEEVSKAKRSGFVVTGRSTKADESSDYFAVNADGTQIYVDDEAATDKVKRSGFVVTGRATKDKSEKYLAVDGEGTHVYIDDEAGDKAKRSGFVVTGRSTKGSSSPELFKIDDSGTQVFVDNEAGDKAKRSGFVVTGRSTKGAESSDYFAVNVDGTQVIVDEMGSDKAKRSGFVVTGRSTKDGEGEKVLAIDLTGTKVYIDDTDQEKAKRSGFVVTGRSTKSDEEDANDYLSVTGESIDFSSSSFNVADKNTNANVLSVTNGNVHVNSDMLLTGEIGKVIARVEGSDLTPALGDVIEGSGVFKLIDDAVIAPESADPLFFDEKGEFVGADDAVLAVLVENGVVLFNFAQGFVVAETFSVRFAVLTDDGSYKPYTVTIPKGE